MTRHWLLVLVLVMPFARWAMGDTVYDGQVRRYGCIREMDDYGLLLEVKCDKADAVRIKPSNLRYFEFNEQVEGFALAGLLRSRCEPCSCSQPSEYYVVEFTKGAGSVFASAIALRSGRFRFKNVTDGAWYSGSVEKIFSVTRFYQCPKDVPLKEVPSSFARDDSQ